MPDRVGRGYLLPIFLLPNIKTSSILDEAINLEVIMRMTENTMEGDGEE